MMRKLFCDRCKKEVDKLNIIKIPDQDKPVSHGAYSTKDAEVCNFCKAFIDKAVNEYNDSMVKCRFAFYEALFSNN